MKDKKLLQRRKDLLKKIRLYERASERAADFMKKKTKEENNDGDDRGWERRGVQRPAPRRFQRPPPSNTHRDDRGRGIREYEGPMDRERMATTTNEWTREKEQKKNTSFVPPPPKKMRANIEERDDANNDDGEEDGEVKEEGERKEKFVPPPGEMTMKAAPYVPPSKQKAAKTWTRPSVNLNTNRNRADGPKIPEIGSRGFTRQRSVSPGIHAKDLAPWTMSEPAKKPEKAAGEEKEKPKNIPETIPEEKEIDVPPPPRAEAAVTAVEAAARAPRKRGAARSSKSPSPAPEEQPRRSTRRSKSASVEPHPPPGPSGQSSKQKNDDKETTTSLSKRTVKELKEMLTAKGLPVDGLKADLVQRLLEE